MTDVLCDTTCGTSKYFAIQYGRDCYCFNDAPTTNTDQSACTYPNSGAPAQIGGSDTAYSVFTTAGVDPGTTLVPKFIGFFSPITNGTTPGFILGLDSFQPDVSGVLTQESCKASCSDYKYFALTEGTICLCSNSYVSIGAEELIPGDTVCALKVGLDNTQAGGGLDCIALFENLDYEVRPGLLTLCSNLCSANMKICTPRSVWLLRLRFGPALVALRGRYAAKPALRPRHYSRQEPEVRVGHGFLDLEIDHDAIDTTSLRSG